MLDKPRDRKPPIGSLRERPIKGFTKTGRPKFMSKAEEKAWRKSIKTVIREEEVGDAKP